MALYYSSWWKQRRKRVFASFGWTFSLLVFIVLALPACGGEQAPAKPDIGKKIDTYLHRLTAAHLFSGIMRLDDNGTTLTKEYGYADIGNSTRMDEHTRFSIGDMSQQFTAAAVLKLQEQNKLTLQDTFCSYISDCPTKWQKITIQQLLEHTSSLPSLRDLLYKGSPFTLKDAVAFLKNAPDLSVSGGRFFYSEADYYLLGEIIAKTSGVTYGQYLQQAFFGPLKMQDTGEETDSDTSPSGHAVSYYDWTRPFMGNGRSMHIPSLQGYGDLYSSIADLTTWNRLLLVGQHTSAQVLSAADLKAITTPYHSVCTGCRGNLSAFSKLSLGYSWLVGTDTDTQQTVDYLYGNVNGFACFTQYYPKIHRLLTVFANLNPTGSSLADSLYHTMFDEDDGQDNQDSQS